VLLIITRSRANNRGETERSPSIKSYLFTEKRIFMYPLHHLRPLLRISARYAEIPNSRSSAFCVAQHNSRYRDIICKIHINFARGTDSVQRTRPSGATAFHGRQFRTAAWHSSHAFLPLFGLPAVVLAASFFPKASGRILRCGPRPLSS